MPILLVGGILLAVVLYAQVERLRSFVCGIFIPQYHYPYVVPLTFAQVKTLSQNSSTLGYLSRPTSFMTAIFRAEESLEIRPAMYQYFYSLIYHF